MKNKDYNFTKNLTAGILIGAAIGSAIGIVEYGIVKAFVAKILE